jgi:hypothetical protein
LVVSHNLWRKKALLCRLTPFCDSQSFPLYF